MIEPAACGLSTISHGIATSPPGESKTRARNDPRGPWQGSEQASSRRILSGVCAISLPAGRVTRRSCGSPGCLKKQAPSLRGSARARRHWYAFRSRHRYKCAVDAYKSSRLLVNLFEMRSKPCRRVSVSELFSLLRSRQTSWSEIMVSDTGHGVPEGIFAEALRTLHATKETGYGRRAFDQ